MFSSFTSHSRAAFPFQMEALISQGLLMMHCGSHWATLALEHKLISCSIPPRINRGPSTCFLSRFCLFLFPPSYLTLSPHPPLGLLHPALLKCTRASACTVNVCMRCINIFESVRTGRMRKVWVSRIKTVRALSICREIGKLFSGPIKIQQPSTRLLRWMRLASIVKPDNQTSIKLLSITTFQWSSTGSIKKKKKSRIAEGAMNFNGFSQMLSQLIQIHISMFSCYRCADEWHQRHRRWHERKEW